MTDLGLGLKPEDACSKAMEGKAMPVPNQVAIAAALRQIAELERRVAALEQQRAVPDPTITTGRFTRWPWIIPDPKAQRC